MLSKSDDSGVDSLSESAGLLKHDNSMQFKQDDTKTSDMLVDSKKNSKVVIKKEISGYENFTRLLQLSLTFFVLFCAFFTC